MRVLREGTEPCQLAVGLDRGADIARVGKDTIDDEEFEVLIAGQLHNNRIVGLAIDDEGERRGGRKTRESVRTFG